jgi:hypothetical protein
MAGMGLPASRALLPRARAYARLLAGFCSVLVTR